MRVGLLSRALMLPSSRAQGSGSPRGHREPEAGLGEAAPPPSGRPCTRAPLAPRRRSRSASSRDARAPLPPCSPRRRQAADALAPRVQVDPPPALRPPGPGRGGGRAGLGRPRRAPAAVPAEPGQGALALLLGTGLQVVGAQRAEGLGRNLPPRPAAGGGGGGFGGGGSHERRRQARRGCGPCGLGGGGFCRPRAYLAPLSLSPPAPPPAPLALLPASLRLPLCAPPPMLTLRRYHVSPSYSLGVSASPVATFQEQRGHFVAVLCAPSPPRPSPHPRRSAPQLGSDQRAPTPTALPLAFGRSGWGADGPRPALEGRVCGARDGRPSSGASSGKPDSATWGLGSISVLAPPSSEFI